jgi:thiol:disulfide interchange protein
MAQIDYRSTATIPKGLVIIAVVFTLARGIDLAVNAKSILHPDLKQFGRSTISWQHFKTKGDGLKSKAAPVEPEISPAVQHELDEMQKQASAGHKILLYQFYASWSDPCKRMEEAALQNGEVEAAINKHFWPVRVHDMQHEKGKNDAVTSALYKKYRVFAFPTLVAVREDGEQIGCLIGDCSSLTTYRFLTRAVSSK